MKHALGLVMTGGGARGAYQAGVLKRIGEIKQVRTGGNPFPIIAGASAGAINGASIASGAEDFSAHTGVLAALWSSLMPSDVFRCDLLSQAHNSLTWLLDLSFGAVVGGGNAHSLLDASPLNKYLRKHLRCERIEQNIKAGHLYALAISATNYGSGKSWLFIHGRQGHPMWNRSRRVTLSTRITVEHVCASAAIPLVFQPVKLKTEQGTEYFGDGCIRLQQPLSPAIRLGAQKILAIGIRGRNPEPEARPDPRDPSLAQVLGVLFDVMFLDHLVTDVEHLDRLNRLLASGQISQSGVEEVERMRPLQSLLVTPSVDIAAVAHQHQKEMPYLIQYFINSLGRDAGSCSDLMSYLLFTPKYLSALVDIGYRDASARIDEIESFLFAPIDGNGFGGNRRNGRAAETAAGAGTARQRATPPASRPAAFFDPDDDDQPPPAPFDLMGFQTGTGTEVQ